MSRHEIVERVGDGGSIDLNGPLVVEQSRHWAQRVLEVPDLSPQKRIERMYLTAYARPPGKEELSAAQAFLDRQSAQYGQSSDVRAWADLAHVLMNAKEFIFIE